MTQLFKQHSQEDQTTAIANFLPSGELFEAKDIPDSVYRMFLRGLAATFVDFNSKIMEVSDQLDIPNTTELLSEWERTVGIPDSCFSTNVSIAQRQAQVMLKLASLGVVTEQDFIDLAAFFGLTIRIEHGAKFGMFTYTFPMIFFPNATAALFTMIVYYSSDAANVFSYRFPFTFGDPLISQLECIFRKLVPAPVDILFIPDIPVPDPTIGAFSSGFDAGFQ